MIKITLLQSVSSCFVREAHHRVLTLKTGSGLERVTPVMWIALLQFAGELLALELGSPHGCQ